MQPDFLTRLRLQLFMVLATIVLFSLALFVNDLLFIRFEFAKGINWIYLPAGIRLLCTLLFGGAGGFGLLIVSWLVCFFVFFPDDPVRAFMGGILAAAAPYLVYRVAEQRYGLHRSLANLTPRRLLICAFAYSVASPALHHIWFALHGDGGNLIESFFVMFAGDFVGTLIVVYGAKGVLALLTQKAGK